MELNYNNFKNSSTFLKIKFVLQAKFGAKFRTFVNIEGIDWCYVMSQMNSVKNGYYRALIKGLKKVAPRLFDPCPFIGLVELINVPPQEQLIGLLPSGCYKIRVTITEASMKFFLVYVLVEFENFH